ncbi:MAG TPA: CDP-alcohol phosphatidyltransferase family protein [Hellea balneolensis]|uniref:CDP-alcohol phosphatidyltransferase family protein n=1 Tax=Hellea balneolensis TaxID=287478 RepID=A0A7C3FYK9_9PROT|nr:CDP-alcohol phosphatidyltransferase family protein [Hellea balneolensis]
MNIRVNLKHAPVETNPSDACLPTCLSLLASQDRHILWGLNVEEWQRRSFSKIGITTDIQDQTHARACIVHKANWVLSSPVTLALRDTPNVALVVGDQAVSVHTSAYTHEIEKAVRTNDIEQLKKLGFHLYTPQELAGDYNESLRKRETPFALNMDTTSRQFIEQKLFDSSYKGITDFVTKFVWPWPAFHVTRLCAHLKISPNSVTTLSLVMVIAAFYFFMHGQWLAGFSAGWFMTFLDTVDGKLARTTMSYSKWGHAYDHGIDLIHPPFWYFAWFAGLSYMDKTPVWLVMCLILILLGYGVDRLIEGLFIVRFKFHIHVWKPIDSFVRFITARRNPNMFIFMVAMSASIIWPQAGYIGFAGVAIWVWACIFFHIIRLAQAMLSNIPIRSWMSA